MFANNTGVVAAVNHRIHARCAADEAYESVLLSLAEVNLRGRGAGLPEGESMIAAIQLMYRCLEGAALRVEANDMPVLLRVGLPTLCRMSENKASRAEIWQHYGTTTADRLLPDSKYNQPLLPVVLRVLDRVLNAKLRGEMEDGVLVLLRFSADSAPLAAMRGDSEVCATIASLVERASGMSEVAAAAGRLLMRRLDQEV